MSIKKRRLIGGDGPVITFRAPGQEDASDEDPTTSETVQQESSTPSITPAVALAPENRISIRDDD